MKFQQFLAYALSLTIANLFFSSILLLDGLEFTASSPDSFFWSLSSADEGGGVPSSTSFSFVMLLVRESVGVRQGLRLEKEELVMAVEERKCKRKCMAGAQSGFTTVMHSMLSVRGKLMLWPFVGGPQASFQDLQDDGYIDPSGLRQ